MTPAELREKVARAIWETREGTFPGRVRLAWQDGTALARTCAMADADAALRAVREAMREPSDVMSDAGYARLGFTPITWTDAGYVWRAMLAASPIGSVE